MRPVYLPRGVILLDLRCDDRGGVLVFGDIATHSHVADADLGYRKDRYARIELHQVVERTLHEVLPVAAHTPGSEYRRGTVRQRGIGLMHRIIPLAAVHQHEIQVGVVLPLRAHERLQRNAAVGIVGHQSDVLHLGIKRTDQVDRTGSPRLQRIGRRGQHDAVLAGEAAEAHHPFGNAAQRYDRLPSVRKAARGR